MGFVSNLALVLAAGGGAILALDKLGPKALVGEKLQQTPPGLTNYGNACFINSSIQMLCSSPHFCMYINNILQRQYESVLLDCKMDKEKALESFQKSSKVYSILNPLRKLCFNLWKLPTRFTQLSAKTWAESFLQPGALTQSDTHEFITFLLALLDQVAEKLGTADGRMSEAEWVDKSSSSPLTDAIFHHTSSFPASLTSSLMSVLSHPSTCPFSTPHFRAVVSSPFQGALARTITCDKCGIQTATEIQPFNVITLNLPVTSTTFFTKIQKGSQHLSTASLDEKGKGTSQDPASMLAFTDATLAERASLEHRSSTALPPPPVSSS
ncbi:hypothetical protein ADUPG1_010657, partial [Aduncisulcus paluster]